MIGVNVRCISKKNYTMTRVYLQLDASVCTVPGGLIEQIFKSFKHFFEQAALNQSGLKHVDEEVVEEASKP